jgi:hypothetical protein
VIWVLKPDQPKATEFAPAVDQSTGILPDLPAVAGKAVHLAFDGGRMTSDAGILLLAAIEQRLEIGADLCSQSTISRLENRPGPTPRSPRGAVWFEAWVPSHAGLHLIGLTRRSFADNARALAARPRSGPFW